MTINDSTLASLAALIEELRADLKRTKGVLGRVQGQNHHLTKLLRKANSDTGEMRVVLNTALAELARMKEGEA